MYTPDEGTTSADLSRWNKRTVEYALTTLLGAPGGAFPRTDPVFGHGIWDQVAILHVESTFDADNADPCDHRGYTTLSVTMRFPGGFPVMPDIGMLFVDGCSRDPRP